MKQYATIQKHIKTLCDEVDVMNMVMEGMKEPLLEPGAESNIFTKNEVNKLKKQYDLDQQAYEAFALFQFKPESVYSWFKDYLVRSGRQDLVDLLDGKVKEHVEGAKIGMVEGGASIQTFADNSYSEPNGVQHIVGHEPCEQKTMWDLWERLNDWWSETPAVRKFNDELKTWYKDCYAADTSGINKRGNKRVEDIFVPLVYKDIFDGAVVDEAVTLNHEQIIARLQNHKTKTGRICIISGEAGMGKTTVVKKICYEWATGSLKLPDSPPPRFVLCIPLCYLKRDVKHRTILAEALQYYKTNMSKWFPSLTDSSNEIESYCNAPDNEKNILFMLDGFDEYTAQNVQISMLNQSGFDLNFCGCLVVTTRPLGLSRLKAMLYHFSLEGFTPALVNEFVEKYVGNQPKELITRLKEPNVWDLAKVPILLQMMCDIWELHRQLPSTKRMLYDNFLRHLTDRAKGDGDMWTRKKINLQSIGQRAYKQLMEEPQGNLTFGRTSFDQQSLSFLLRIGLLHHRDYQQVAKQIYTSKLEASKNDKVFLFCHKSFHEYMAAIFIENYMQMESENFSSDKENVFKFGIQTENSTSSKQSIKNGGISNGRANAQKQFGGKSSNNGRWLNAQERQKVKTNKEALVKVIGRMADSITAYLVTLGIFNVKISDSIKQHGSNNKKASRIIYLLKKHHNGRMAFEQILILAGAPDLFETIFKTPN